MKHISHLRISFHNNIVLRKSPAGNSENLNADNLYSIRIDNISGIPNYIQEMKRLKVIELNNNGINQFPDWFAQFTEIKKVVLTTRDIEFSDDF